MPLCARVCGMPGYRARITCGLLARALFVLALLVPGTLLGLGCQQSGAPEPALPAPVESTALGPGDVFEMVIVGEKDLPTEYQVAQDGTVNLPYIHRVKVAGLERHQLEDKVTELLKEKRILTDPSVVVKVKEYASKQVTVLGQVRKPGSFPLTPGLTLIQALSRAGGLTQLAYRSGVVLTRTSRDGGTRTVIVDVDRITSGEAQDILLQHGDRIFVRERVF